MARFIRTYSKYCWLPLLLALAGCHGTPPSPGMKLGKPYMVDGRTYYPEYDPTYDKIGMASWYGPGFHGKYTANGEVYNQNDLTAAHPTLPMPSLVRVTNLSNGKSLVVRINDRGPFKKNRIIDLSRKAAHELGITSTAEVRVQFLKKETEEYLASLHDGGAKLDMMAYNAQTVNNRDFSIIHSTEPNSQVVESTVATTHAGQTVDSAAPIMSVASDALAEEAQPRPKPDQKVITIVSAKLPAPDGTEVHAQPAKEVQISSLDPVYSSKYDANTSRHKPAPSARAKVETVGNTPTSFYIQAGSFASEENAHRLSSRLASLASVDIGKVEMGTRTWWRVRLGPYHSAEEAAQVLNTVHEAGQPDARIVHQ